MRKILDAPRELRRAARDVLAAPRDFFIRSPLTPSFSPSGGEGVRRRGEGAFGIARRFNFIFRNRPAARGAFAADVFEQIKFLRAGRTLGFHHLENFRDDHARLAHNHGVADTNVFAADLVLVV